MKNTILRFKKLNVVLLAIIAITMLALAIPATQVEAAQLKTSPAPDNQWLELLYDRVSLAADNQGNRIEYSKEIAAKSQTWIDTLKEDGQDVSALEAALATFNAEIAKAEEFHHTAEVLLSNHAGFDDVGNVTDVRMALETIRTAANNLRQAHLIITQATLDFRSVVSNWRQEFNL
jgi:hypothetical protein